MATYKSFQYAQSVVKDLFARAKSYRTTHVAMLDDRRKRLFSLPGYKGTKHQKFTRYELGYLQGMWDMLVETQRADLVWAFNTAPEGEPHTPMLYSELLEKDRPLACSDIDRHMGFYWKNADGSISPHKFY